MTDLTPGKAGQINPRTGRVICGAKKRNGDPCESPPMRNATRCRMHGGASKRSKAAAERRDTTNKAATALAALGHDPNANPVDPAEALLRLVTAKHYEVQWWRQLVQSVTRDDTTTTTLIWGVLKREQGVGPLGPVDSTTEGPALHMAVQGLHTAERDLANYATAALKAGVQERQMQVQEALALQLVGAIHRILGGLQLTPAQQDTAGTLVPAVLRSLDTKEQT